MIRTNRTARALAVSTLATAALVLSACGNSSTEPQSVAATDTPAAATTTAEPTNAPFPTGPHEATAPASEGASLSVTDIRVGRHDGFDRVVYELDGTGTPGWSVGYVPSAVQDGSGNPVDVSGEGFLEVRILGVGYPFDTGIENFAGPFPVPGVPGGSVVEVSSILIFEGQAQSYIGTAKANQNYRISELQDPPRVIIDVEH
ncbi:MAG: hypothetical protein GX542_04065 [Rhodococcus sp.]|nr:hypothetical protein [Rhodococcus sp. (in: high G+C Gram-positive bacteria)]